MAAKIKKTQQTKKQKRSKEMGKYYHKKTERDGIIFDSQTEAEYYDELISLKKKGIIRKFTMQDEFILQDKYILADGKCFNVSDYSEKEFKKLQKKYPKCTVQAIKYISDFIVEYADGTIKVIDVKGVKTTDFKIKEKMFNYRYPQYGGLVCMVKVKGKWMTYEDKKKAK